MMSRVTYFILWSTEKSGKDLEEKKDGWIRKAKIRVGARKKIPGSGQSMQGRMLTYYRL